MRLVPSLIVFVLSAAPFSPAIAGDLSAWPHWRGPARTGRIDEAAWPDKLDSNHLQQVWRVELGSSYSGPIVTDDRVFVIETYDGKTEHVQSLDRQTGMSLWEASWTGSINGPSMNQDSPGPVLVEHVHIRGFDTGIAPIRSQN